MSTGADVGDDDDRVAGRLVVAAVDPDVAELRGVMFECGALLPAHPASANIAAPKAVATTGPGPRIIRRMLEPERSTDVNVSRRIEIGRVRRGEGAVTVEFGLFNSACVLPQFNGDEHRRIMDEVAIVQAADRAGFKYTWA